ncbi:MAG TPA: carboxypeptidase regulatory-like domain-containing protein [Polyangia bacterium]
MARKAFGSRVAVLLAAMALLSGWWLWRERQATTPTGVGVAVAVDRPAGPGGFVDPHEVDLGVTKIGPGGGIIRGTVVDADGRAIEGAIVSHSRVRLNDQQFLPDFGRPLQLTRTNREGQFRFDRVAAGAYAVSATAKSHVPQTAGPIELGNGEEKQVQVRLVAGGVTLSGHVFDVGGGPVPHAKVSALESGRPRPSGVTFFPRVYPTIADETGAYEVTLDKGEFQVTVEAAGYVALRGQLRLGGPTTQDFRLVPGARISGRVVEGPEKRPVAGAHVWVLLGRGGRANGDLKTAEDGSFTIDALEPDTYRVGARKGRLLGSSAPVSLSLAHAIANVEIEVYPAFVIAGQVVDSHGKPVADARMQVFKDQPPWEQPFIGTTAADGRFRFEGLAPGPYRLEGAAHGTTSARQRLRVDSDRLDLTLVLPVGASVKGQITSDKRVPVANAVVEIRLNSRSPGTIGLFDRKTTDASGHFAFTGLAAGELAVSVMEKDAGMASLENESLGEGEAKVVNLTLQPGGSVSGTVRKDGKPVAGVRVEGRAVNSHTQGPTDVTAADGTYRVSPLPAGPVMIMVSESAGVFGGSGKRPEHKQVTLAWREHKRDVDFSIAGARQISGTVVGPNGAAVSGAEVTAMVDREARDPWNSGTTTFTGEDGRFTVEDLAAGQHTLRVRHAGFADAEVPGIDVDATGVKIQLQPEAIIAGVVRTSDDKPVVAYTVVLSPAAKPGAPPGRPSFGLPTDRPVDIVHDAEGRFALSRVRAGDHTLHVRTSLGQGVTAPVTVAAGERKTGLRLVIDAGARITGLVVDEAGGPLPNVSVFGYSRSSTAGNLTAQTDAAGRFRLEGVPPGEGLNLEVAGDPQRFVPERKRIESVASGTTDLGTIRLARGDITARKKEGSWNGHPGFGLDETTYVVRAIRAGSPAAQAGIVRGDVLLSVDGKDVRSMTPGGLDYRLRGRPGSPITVVVQTPGAALRTLTLNRIDMTSPPPR